jgi:hypothetical protein
VYDNLIPAREISAGRRAHKIRNEVGLIEPDFTRVEEDGNGDACNCVGM